MKKLLLLFTVMLLSACAGSTCRSGHSLSSADGSIGGAAVTKADLARTRYDFVSFNDMEIRPLGVGDLNRPRMEFNDGMRMSGMLCNNFTGQPTIEKGKLRAVMASTRRMCPDTNLMKAETAFFNAISEGATVTKSGDMMNIRHGDNHFVLKRHVYRK